MSLILLSGMFLCPLLSAKNSYCSSKKYPPATVFRGADIPNYFISDGTFLHLADHYLSPSGEGVPRVACAKHKSGLTPYGRQPVDRLNIRGAQRIFYKFVDSSSHLEWLFRFFESRKASDHPVSWHGVKIIALDTTTSPYGSHAFNYFFDVWMPQIRSPFILLNYGDHGVPNDVVSRKGIRGGFAMTSEQKSKLLKSLDNPYLVAWYATNFDGSVVHSKIRPFPIGRYDKFNRAKLLNDKSLKTSKRKFKIYSDTTMNNSSSRMKAYGLKSRAEIYEEIKGNPYIDFQQGYMDRELQWQKRTEYMFSLSLVGKGYDCYRTWESLYLGNIVLLQSSPLDPLFEGLPVVIIKDWSEINEENLKKWAAKYHDASTNPKYREKLTSVYWLKMLEADIQAGEKKFNTYRPSYG